MNRGQEFVIGGYTPSPKNFDALIIGYYEPGSCSCRPHPEWLYTGFACGVIQAAQTA